MIRSTTAVAALCAALMVSGCSTGDAGAGKPGSSGTSGASQEAGCGACTRELADLRTRIEGLPGVGELLTLRTYPGSPTNGAGVKVELRSTDSGDNGVQDRVAELVWRSRVAPVDEVVVTVADADGRLVPTLPYDFTETSRQHDTYVEEWGPRPVG